MFSLSFILKCLKAVKIRVSIIGLSAEVRVCTVLARETGGMYLYNDKKKRVPENHNLTFSSTGGPPLS